MNAEADDLDLMIQNMQTRKSKKSKRSREAANQDDGVDKKKKKDEKEKAGTSKVYKNSTSTSSSTGTSSSNKLNEPVDPAFNKVKDDYSIAKDPNASEVLKSIFTSHKSAAEQTKAHWVTYNPFYN